MDNNTPKYVISVASEILGIHPQTLRQYERLGLVVPARLDGKNRLYSENDIEKLKFITYLTRDMGVNLAGVEIIISMQEQINELNKKIISVGTDSLSMKNTYKKIIKVERDK